MTVRELLIRIGFDVDKPAKVTAAVSQVKGQLKTLERQGQSSGRIAAGGLDQITEGARRAQGALKNMGASLSKSGDKVQQASSGFLSASRVLMAAAAAMATGSIAGAADDMMNLDGRLRTLIEDEKERYQIEDDLYRISQSSRQGYKETGDLFFRVAGAAQKMGLSMQDSERVTEIVGKALTVGGATAQQASATILQLGQALSSGQLQGDELASLKENASTLMNAMADTMGVTMGELKDMGAQGELTSDMVIDAILKSGATIDAQFGKMPTTIGQALTKVSNSWNRMIQFIQRDTGVFGKIGTAISEAVDFVDQLAQSFYGLPLSEQSAAVQEWHDRLMAAAEYLQIVYNYWLVIYNFLTNVFGSAVELVAANWSELQAVGSAILADWVPILENIWSGVMNLVSAFQILWPIIAPLVGFFGVLLYGAITKVFSIFSSVFDIVTKIVEVIARMVSGIVRFFELGGRAVMNMFGAGKSLSIANNQAAAAGGYKNTQIYQRNTFPISSPSELPAAMSAASDGAMALAQPGY